MRHILPVEIRLVTSLLPLKRAPMKYLVTICALTFFLSIGLTACATDEPRHAAPPPGSHSPFSDSDERDATGVERDRPEPTPEPDEEEEPDIPDDRN